MNKVFSSLRGKSTFAVHIINDEIKKVFILNILQQLCSFLLNTMKESCGKVWVSIYDVIVLHLSPGIEEFSSLNLIRKFTNSCKTDPTVCLQRTSIVGVHLINCKNVLHPPLNICLV